MSNQENNENKMSEQDKAVLLDHDYDGIQEFDYPLPSWWVMTFVGAIIFAIPYMIYYGPMGGPSLKEEMNKELDQLNKVRAEYAISLVKFDSEKYEAIKSEDGITKGATVYEANCLACHEEGGKGDIGPNLTDAFWMHAKGTPDTIYEVVVNGREDLGMPAWLNELPREEIYQVVAYVMSLKNTNVVGGKEPQGDKVEEE